MKLEFAGAPMITAPRAAVWARLLDPDAVAQAAPGVESVEPIDDHHFKVITGLGIGAMRLKFTLEVELSDIVEPESASMRARGKAPGSVVDVQTAIRLDETGPSETQLHWQATATIRGTVASLGSRLLESAARKLTDDFWDTFAHQASTA